MSNKTTHAIIYKYMKLRVVWGVLVSLIDEAIAVAMVLWLLPMYGIHLPFYWLIFIALGLGIISLVLTLLGNRTPTGKSVSGLEGMVGMKGRVVSPLKPQGMVKIKGELWQATSEEGNIETDEEVTVVAAKSLTLLVRKTPT